MSTLRIVLAVDTALLLRVRSWEAAWLTRLMRALTHLGDTSSWLALGAVLAASGGHGSRYALLLSSGGLLATLYAQVLKRSIRRQRPTSQVESFTALVENPDRFSFPSGHTAAAFGIAVALAGEGVGLGPLLLTLAGGIAISRVYLGAHYPLDVATGALVGALAGIVTRIFLASELLLP